MQRALHKFGGTSLADADCFRKVAAILTAAAQEQPLAVVVSATAGTTNRLIQLLDEAQQRDPAYEDHLTRLKLDHLITVGDLLPETQQRIAREFLESDFQDLRDILRAVWLGRSYAELTLDLVSGYGELWSARLLDLFLQSQNGSSVCLDARETLIVEHTGAGVQVDWVLSREKLDRWCEGQDARIIVITGYIASTRTGTPSTLKRNGSDHSASIFAALLSASAITIWTDVDGILSADPTRAPDAIRLPYLTYHEAMELAYFGARVIHPLTFAPAIKHKIPIQIKNTFRPQQPGTKIHAAAASTEKLYSPVVKGIASIDNITLINVEGSGMLGVPGIAQRVFGTLQQLHISVIMISQASSEHSICLAVPSAQSEQARTALKEAFASELQKNHIQSVESVAGCSILAVVGEGMVEKPGVAGRFFTALGRAGINIRAVAQGSSERNISIVIDSVDAPRAVRAVHSGFYLSDQTLSVGLIGPGLIGRAFLEQLKQQREYLKTHYSIDLRVRGVLSSQKMLLAEDCLDARETAWADAEEADLQKFVEFVRAEHLPHRVIIDCTASEKVADFYADWLAQGLHVITPNKKAGSGSYDSYRKIRALTKNNPARFYYEATVGAGLPVISTLRELVQTGDAVTRIEGVLSGTLSYIFNAPLNEVTFSKVVREAREKGYTEPDPREDLSGMDVARKALILAREMGLALDLDDIDVENLVPDELLDCASTEEFLERLPEHDVPMAARVAEAERRDEILRYVAIIEPGVRTQVKLRPYPRTHPFARIQGSDNIIAFHTKRYFETPLIVQGPGAGPDVTAGGIFADLLRLAAHLGAQT